MTNPSISGWKKGGTSMTTGKPPWLGKLCCYIHFKKHLPDISRSSNPQFLGFHTPVFSLDAILGTTNIDIRKPCEACHCAMAPECPECFYGAEPQGLSQMVISMWFRCPKGQGIFMDFQHTPWMSLADCCSKQGVMFWSGWTWDRKNM